MTRAELVATINQLVEQERTRQQVLHAGETCADEIPDGRRLAITLEELGEVSQALQADDADGVISELVQVAACCQAWLEFLLVFGLQPQRWTT